MSNISEQAEKDLQIPEYDPVLVYAWELYETYSSGSQAQKRSNSGIRQLIIWLIFFTSVLAVITTLPGVRQWLEFTARPWTETNIGPWTSFVGNFALSATLIVLSVTTSALLAFAGQFSPLRAWIMYRAGADRIRSEIYLYRMKAGPYAGKETQDEARKLFLKRVEIINQDIYELETAPPFLQLVAEDDGTFNHSVPRRVYNGFKRFVFLRWRTNTSGKGRVKAITPDQYQKVKDGEKMNLSGRYYPDADNGFNVLTIDDYIQYRAMPQRNWYVKKVKEDYEKIKDWRKVTLTIGGASAVLAAIQLEPYIVITTAAAVAVNTHIQLNMIGSTYGNYHITASRIDSELVRWRNLPEDEQYSHKVISDFVTQIESILEAERIVWMQQASQAQQESEQTLIKGASKREAGTSLLKNRDIMPPTINGESVSQGGKHDVEAQARAYVAGEAEPTTLPEPTSAPKDGDTPTGNEAKPTEAKPTDANSANAVNLSQKFENPK